VSSHAHYAILTGTAVAGSWAVLDPLSLGTLSAVGAGYVVGIVGYFLVAVVHEWETGAKA